MPPTLRRSLLATTTIALALLCGLATAAEETKRFEIEHVEAQNASMALRSLAGTRNVETDGNALVVTDSAEGLDVAEKVLELVDIENDAEPAIHSIVLDTPDDADDSVLTRFMLEEGQAPEVMKALRGELSIRHVMVSADPSMVIIRDTNEKTEAAIDLVGSLKTP